ncbi:hypothetical protein [Nocardia fluminea]|uniref:hypothetical protein n=1 Tax=Nocardia fluminea TaxID=134984 RepID=UPI003D12AB54
MDASVAAGQPLPRFGEPEEVAAMVGFVVTEATFSTGSEFVLRRRCDRRRLARSALVNGEPGHPRMPEPAQVHETHSGVVFLYGDRAYKVKKPLRTDFLDFSIIVLRGCRRIDDCRCWSRSRVTPPMPSPA